MAKTSALPAIIHPNHSVQVLRPLPKVHSKFDESFLQDLLAKHPELLPVSSVRSDVGSLICVGREIPLPSGTLDNLYLSSGGYPVLVETKLWRNPQARREVLSQTLDYIKDLTSKDFEWFHQQWRSWQKAEYGETASFMERLSEQAEDEIDEREFVDRVNRALARGDILALIVGDGIETRLQELVDHLCKDSAHLRYTLTLCELSFFETGPEESERLLVVPRIVSNVEPVERAYVRVELAPGLEDKLAIIPVRVTGPTDLLTARANLSSEDFFRSVEREAGIGVQNQIEEAINDLVQSFGLETDFKAASVMLKLPDPAGEAPGASLIAFEKNGRVYNAAHMKGRLSRWETLTPEDAGTLCAEYWKELHAIDPLFGLDGMSHMAPKQFIPFSKLQPKWPEIRECIGRTVAKIRAQAERTEQK